MTPVPVSGAAPRILVVGVGNVLRGDDMFGVEVARRLGEMDLPPSVRVIETGIAGVSLVQELLAGYDALLVIDAVQRGRPPGTLVVLEPRVPGPDDMTEWERMAYLADLHQSDPSRVFILAQALHCLPARVLVLGCEIGDCDELLGDLTAAVSEAVPRAVDTAVATIASWLRADDGVEAIA